MQTCCGSCRCSHKSFLLRAATTPHLALTPSHQGSRTLLWSQSLRKELTPGVGELALVGRDGFLSKRVCVFAVWASFYFGGVWTLSGWRYDILHGIMIHFTALRHGTSRRENTLSPFWAFVGGRDAYFMAQRDGIWVFGLAFCTIYMHTDYDDMEGTTGALGVGVGFVVFCVGSGRCGT
jgi:hypothetical protein